MLMSKKRWEEEKEKNANYGGWVEEEGKKMETLEEKVQEKQGWRRRKSEKEEQENLFPEKSHLTRNRLNKKATWNIYLLFMTPLYSQIALSLICTGGMMAGKTSLAWGHRACNRGNRTRGQSSESLDLSVTL